jgi:hypothetical protein
MQRLRIAGVLMGSLVTFSVQARSLCVDPASPELLQASHVAVVATVEARSVKPEEGGWQQTVLWRVNENWKGPHYKGSTFTTRVRLSRREDVMPGQAYVLMLKGTEPYEWEPCSADRGLLQDSLPEVYEIQREFLRQRRGHPDASQPSK